MLIPIGIQWKENMSCTEGYNGGDISGIIYKYTQPKLKS